MKAFEKSYIAWIATNFVPWDRFSKVSYWKLFRKLYEEPFHWDEKGSPLDENRAMDGLEYRRKFLNETDIMRESKNIEDLEAWGNSKTASLLEVLVGIAVRIEREYLGDPANLDYAGFFYTMLQNAGLLKFNDSQAENIENLHVGGLANGGEKRADASLLFCRIFMPLKVELPKTERNAIWSRMMQYICENRDSLMG